MPRDWATHDIEVDIGFPTGNHDDREECRITVFDAKSHVMLVELRIEFTAFFRAVRGRGRTPGTIFANPRFSDLLGATKEQKTVPIFVPAVDHLSDPEVKRETGKGFHGEPLTAKEVEALDLLDQALKPYEVDGWYVSIRDALNWHNELRDIPAGAAAQLREVAGFDDDARGHIRNVSFSRWLRPDGKVVRWPNHS